MDHTDHSEAALSGIRCTYCEDVVSEGIAVECTHCTGVSLCLQCFSCGVEIGLHHRDHNYRVTVVSELPERLHIFDKNWISSEDEALIEAVEQYGFGSWQDVAACVKTKDADECEKHYHDYYIDGNIGEATATLEKPMKCIDDAGECFDLFCPVSLTVQEQQELGYMALRDDFEREFDNEAELCLCDVSINYNDTPVDTAFKLFQVDTYRQRLKERKNRKTIAKDYEIFHNSTSIGFRAFYSAKKKQSREERQFHDKYKVFARFLNPTNYSKLHRNIFRQRKLTTNVKTLAKFNGRGVKSLKGKFKIHAMQMNGALNGIKKRRRKRKNCYR